VLDANLIFDIGAHRGEDTEFYLKKGFRVVSVEANPALYEGLRQKFRTPIADGRLTVVNKAISGAAGKVKFYVNKDVSEWGTLDPDWVERNRRKGFESREIEVDAVTTADLFREFGVPYYVKIDIEGYDTIALEGFAGIGERPKYVSIESDKVSFRGIRQEIALLSSLGFDQFNIVSQRSVLQQRPPRPPKEGVYVEHQFEKSSSGLFGAELPGPWLSAEQAIAAYRPIFLRYALTGDDPFVTQRWLREVLRGLGFRSNHYDTHARRSG
jgi:FkbM family methyltransferase